MCFVEYDELVKSCSFILFHTSKYIKHNYKQSQSIVLINKFITKINYSSSYWTGNKVNVDANNLGIDILEADGLTPSKPANEAYGKPGDAYPAGSTSFTKITNYQVTDIEEANGVITFKVNGGIPTGIKETNSSDAPRKILRDGRVVILRGEKEFDILGRVL